MKATLSRILILSALLLPTAWAWTSGPPVAVTHTVVSRSAGGATSGMDIMVQISNPGDICLSDLSLSVVQTSPFFKVWTPLEVARLAPHQSRQLSLHLQARSATDKGAAAQRLLHFIGSYNDAKGKSHEFPVTSHAGTPVLAPS